MENSTLLPDSLSFLLEELRLSGLPKSIAERPEFLSSLILGTENDDSLTGTENRDYIFGLDGNDTIEGLSGDDFLFSRAGDSTISGGDGRDRIYARSGRDTLIGGAGDDRFRDISGGNEIDGGEGRDTVNYRNIESAIALEFNIELSSSTGSDVPLPDTGETGLQIVQADRDPDNISNIERIIAPEGKKNLIDFRENSFSFPTLSVPPTITAPAIDVDLSANRLSFEDTTLTVENFSDVVGSLRDDVLIGNEAANDLDGSVGSNRLEGLGGNDTLSTFESDILVGGGGRDTFRLKAADKIISAKGFPGVSSIQGSTIVDFDPNFDKIQLSNAGSSVQVGSQRFLIYEGFSQLPIGDLSEDLFRLSGSASPTPDSPFLSYDAATGDLVYVQGNLGSSKIATLQGAPALDASNISIV